MENNANSNTWYAVLMDRSDNDWGFGSFDRAEAERMAIRQLEDHPDVRIAVIEEGNDPVCIDVIDQDDFRTPLFIGKWNGTDIDVVKIDGALYALNGWNGEKYLHCWKCIDRFTAAPDGEEYEIRPVYDWAAWNDDAGEFQDENGGAISGIIGYEIA